jgi:disulfide bond formation protein DsbB
VNTSVVSLFLALLAVWAQVSVVGGMLLVIAARWSSAIAVARDRMLDVLGPSALLLALAVALISTAGSLYFSEVSHFIPCKLCWYQRIAMYPLVPLLGIAAYRRDLCVRPYVAVQAGLGGAISMYHVLVERFPTLESSVCDPTNPCTLIWVKRFGYLTIPTMALSAFALIVTLMAAARPPIGDEAV